MYSGGSSSNPAAPNVTSATIDTPHYTTVGGVEMWYLTGTITLPTGSSDYAHLKKIHIQIDGLPDLLVISRPFGTSPISFTTNNQIRDDASHTYTVKFAVENEDAAISSSPYQVTGVTIDAGTGVGGGSETTAPKITAASCTVAYSMPWNETQADFDLSITMPVSDPAYSHLTQLSIVATSSLGGGKVVSRQIGKIDSWTVDGSNQIHWKGGEFKQLAASQSWSIRITSINDKGTSNPDVYVITGVTIQALKVNSVTAAASSKATDGPSRGVLQPFTVTPVLNGNQVPVNVAVWLDRGDGTKRWKQWWKLESVGQVITITDEYAMDAASGTWTVYVEAGAIGEGSQPSANAVSTTFAVTQIVTPPNNWITAATVTLSYIQALAGAYEFKFTAQATHALSNAEMWFGRLTEQRGTGTGGSFVASSDADGTEHNVGDFGPTPQPASIVVSGTTVTITSNARACPNSAITLRYKWYATSRRNSPAGTSTGQASFTGAATFVDAVLDPSKGTITFGAAPAAPNVTDAAVNIETKTLRNSLHQTFGFYGTVTCPADVTNLKRIEVWAVGPDGGTQQELITVVQGTIANNAVLNWKGDSLKGIRDSVNHTYSLEFRAINADGVVAASPLTRSATVTGISGAAPAPLSVSAVLQSTSAGTLAAVTGMPVWNAVLTITLDTGNANYVHTKELRISIPGYADDVITAWTPNGSSQITYTTATRPQDSSSHALTVSVLARNENGEPSAAATTSITVPAADIPFVGAPDAPTITSATATPTYFMVDNATAAAFDLTITMPVADPNYSHLKALSIVATSSLGGGKVASIPIGRIETWTVDGSNQIHWQGGQVLQTASSQTWGLRISSINDDGAANPTVYVVANITVQAAKAQSVTGTAGAKASDGPNRGVLQPVTITPVMVGNQVPLNATVWLDRGDGVKRWKKWYKLTSVGQTITISDEYALDLADGTWTVYVEAGAIGEGAQPSGNAVSTTISITAIATPPANWITGAAVNASYIPAAGGAFLVRFTVTASVPLSTTPELWFGRLTAQKLVTATGLAASDADGTETSWGDANSVSVAGDTITIVSNPFPVSSVTQHTWRFKWKATSRRGGGSGTTTLENSFAGVSSADVILDPTKGNVTVGNAPAAPNVVNTSTAAVFTASAGSMPLYGFSGNVICPADVTNLKRIDIYGVGPDADTQAVLLFSVPSYQIVNGATVPWKSGTYRRDTTNHGWSIQFRCLNADGLVAASAFSVSVTVTGTADARAAAPAAPNVTMSGTTFTPVSMGTIPMFYFSGTVTCPADVTGLASIELVAIGPDADTQTETLRFIASTAIANNAAIGWKAGLKRRDTASHSWKIEARCYNADGLVSATPASATLTVTGASETVDTTTIGDGLEYDAPTNKTRVRPGGGLMLSGGSVTARVNGAVGINGNGELYAKTGTGMTTDGAGNLTPYQGPGLTYDGYGRLVPNGGATVTVNGFGQLVVPQSSLGLAQFTGYGQVSGYQPYAMYNGLPSATDITVPRFIINTADWKVYRNTGTSWTAQVNPSDIVAGNITATVTITAPVINGGSATLTANGITTTLNNVVKGAIGGNKTVGLSVEGTVSTFVHDLGIDVFPPGDLNAGVSIYCYLGPGPKQGRIALGDHSGAIMRLQPGIIDLTGGLSLSVNGGAVVCSSGYYVGGTQVINTSGTFVGAGVSCPNNNVSCYSLSVGAGGLSVSGNVNLSGTFSGTHSGTCSGTGSFSSGSFAGTHSGSWSGSLSVGAFTCSSLNINGYSGTTEDLTLQYRDQFGSLQYVYTNGFQQRLSFKNGLYAGRI